MLDVRNISFPPLFSDLSFSLSKQEILLVRGTNGAGKSTLLRMIAGLIPSPPGALFWDGKRIQLSVYQQNILYSGHLLGLHPEALLKDQVNLWHYHYRVEKKVIEAALHIWGVAPFTNQKTAHLSQGQQKRLSLSRLHWLARPLWILDEPHSNLDTEGRKILEDTLAHHLKNEGLAIFASHEKRPDVRELCL
ncbi:MAG: heme ABC exporter ATP-binding protein CcmA [Alphaproteobacteria bacterium]|nr:heme ABC exporter ATP-binding protein CcmA [Alphaproteobacteria bacterium]